GGQFGSDFLCLRFLLRLFPRLAVGERGGAALVLLGTLASGLGQLGRDPLGLRMLLGFLLRPAVRLGSCLAAFLVDPPALGLGQLRGYPLGLCLLAGLLLRGALGFPGGEALGVGRATCLLGRRLL